MLAERTDGNVTETSLGESPCWDVASQCLYWTDIKAGVIYRYDPIKKSHACCKAPKMAAFVLPTTDRGLIAGLEDGLYLMNFEEERFELLTLVDNEDVRLNDGKCDPVGRIWFGTMPRDEESDEKTGKLYMFDGTLHEMDSGFGIANGKGWTRDGRFMYHVDTSENTVWRYHFDIDDGAITKKESFLELDGSPDGMCVDGIGNIYAALYGEGRVDIYSPQGSKSGSIDVPAKEVTSCAFGGPDMKTLYITTAKDGLFSTQMDVAGVPECPASTTATIDKDFYTRPQARSS